MSLHVLLSRDTGDTPPPHQDFHPPLAKAAFPYPPPAGLSVLSSWQSLVREPACLYSSQWCCSAIPIATALGILPPPGNCPKPARCPLNG